MKRPLLVGLLWGLQYLFPASVALALDLDGDGYQAGEPSRAAPRWSDCDDSRADVHPGAPDLTVDGCDQDCDGIDGPALDPWGGWVGRTLSATGFFRVAEVDEGGDSSRWWLVTPAGHPFFSVGVNAISFSGDYSPSRDRWPYGDNNRERYGSQAAWREELLRRYEEWGINTAGAWSEWDSLGSELPYTVILGLSGANWEEGDIPDYFAPEFAARCDSICAVVCAPLSADLGLVGYFIDNELRWGPDWRSLRFLFGDYLLLSPEAPGKVALVAFLERYFEGDIVALNAFWETAFDEFSEILEVTALGSGTAAQNAVKEEFLYDAADAFYATTAAAIRDHDPNHLVLGERLQAQSTHAAVVAVSGSYVDVVSVNRYRLNAAAATTMRLMDEALFGVQLYLPDEDWFEQFHVLSGRPVLHTEFGYRAADSGMRNSWPPIYPILLTQAGRARHFERDARRSLRSPWVVGYHWFKHSDQPYFGRFDGEDNNFGLVDLHDDPYARLVNRMREVNRWWVLGGI
jgi:agarase